MTRFALTIICLTASLIFSAPSRAETRLVMFEASGCYWCDKWRREIGPIYGKTAEGKHAPLTVIDVYAALPADIALERRAVYTPTFVLLENGVEVNRIEGYPGEAFFWGLLERMLADLDKALVKS